MHGAFPVGYCPHDHICQWRRLKPRLSVEEAWEREMAKQADLTRRFYPNGVPEAVIVAPPIADSEDDMEDDDDLT
jgi:hypothetical protein